MVATGPVFDGRVEEEVERYCQQVTMAVAEEAAARIKAYLPEQYKYLGHHGGNLKKNPVPRNAGYYAAQVNAKETPEGALVSDDGVVYGPWLEGASEQNSARRFPGYAAFRVVNQTIDHDSAGIAEDELPPYIVAMNL